MQQQEPSLLILAAGMGSRYGGLKQMDGFGPNGETIIDYSIYDAILCGFTKIVFIIRRSFETEFKQRMHDRWKDKVAMHYVFQELEDLPEPYVCPDERQKPWGTGHALWAARDAVCEPFGVINADDYYGREALHALYHYLSNNQQPNDYAVVAYQLEKTLSDFGAVNRGVCHADEKGSLHKVVECKGIMRNEQGIIEYNERGQLVQFAPDTLVSMNMWAFQSSYFDYADVYFKNFLEHRINEANSEFYIPELIQDLIDRNVLHVDILSSPSNWFGVTYKEDKPHVQAQISAMIDSKYYPLDLCHGA